MNMVLSQFPTGWQNASWNWQSPGIIFFTRERILLVSFCIESTKAGHRSVSNGFARLIRWYQLNSAGFGFPGG